MKTEKSGLAQKMKVEEGDSMPKMKEEVWEAKVNELDELQVCQFDQNVVLSLIRNLGGEKGAGRANLRIEKEERQGPGEDGRLLGPRSQKRGQIPSASGQGWGRIDEGTLEVTDS